MSAAYRHCVNGLLTSIVWNIDRQAVWCVHYWHCVFIRCVGGYSLYVVLQLLGLFIIARGLGWVFWGLGGGVQVGGGGWRWNIELKIFFSLRNVPGVLKRQKKKIFGGGGGFWGVWGAPRPHPGVARGRKTIHFFLWPWHGDRLKFWSGPAWRSKVIIRKPWRRKKKKRTKKKKRKKKKKKKNSDKPIRHSRREAGNA